jgi:cell division septum initiation protein DivIVA
MDYEQLYNDVLDEIEELGREIQAMQREINSMERELSYAQERWGLIQITLFEILSRHHGEIQSVL